MSQHDAVSVIIVGKALALAMDCWISQYESGVVFFLVPHHVGAGSLVSTVLSTRSIESGSRFVLYGLSWSVAYSLWSALYCHTISHCWASKEAQQ